MRPEKQFLLDEIREKMANAKAFVFASYKKLEPNVAAGFRTNLAKTGGPLRLCVSGSSLKRLKSRDVTFDEELLEGHIAVVFADEDPVQTTKTIFQFSKRMETS